MYTLCLRAAAPSKAQLFTNTIHSFRARRREAMKKILPEVEQTNCLTLAEEISTKFLELVLGTGSYQLRPHQNIRNVTA